MLNKEQRIVLSVVFGVLAVLGSICIYGFTIGGEPFSVKYILYCLVTSLVMITLVFLFVFRKESFKRMITSEFFLITVLAVAFIQILGYQPLNAFTKNDMGVEYEVEITQGLEYRGYNVCFIDKEGISRCIDTTFDISYIFIGDDELMPRLGGRMIVREIVGGFNRKYFEIVKVTYEPEAEPLF